MNATKHKVACFDIPSGNNDTAATLSLADGDGESLSRKSVTMVKLIGYIWNLLHRCAQFQWRHQDHAGRLLDGEACHDDENGEHAHYYENAPWYGARSQTCDEKEQQQTYLFEKRCFSLQIINI